VLGGALIVTINGSIHVGRRENCRDVHKYKVSYLEWVHMYVKGKSWGAGDRRKKPCQFYSSGAILV